MTREQLAAILEKQKGDSDLDALTDREVEVVSLLGQGGARDFICREMQISEEQLGAFKDSIREKCGLKDEVALIRFAASQRRV